MEISIDPYEDQFALRSSQMTEPELQLLHDFTTTAVTAPPAWSAPSGLPCDWPLALPRAGFELAGAASAGIAETISTAGNTIAATHDVRLDRTELPFQSDFVVA